MLLYVIYRCLRLIAADCRWLMMLTDVVWCRLVLIGWPIGQLTGWVLFHWLTDWPTTCTVTDINWWWMQMELPHPANRNWWLWLWKFLGLTWRKFLGNSRFLWALRLVGRCPTGSSTSETPKGIVADPVGASCWDVLGGSFFQPQELNFYYWIWLVWIPDLIDFHVFLSPFRGIFLRCFGWTYAVLKGHHVNTLSREDLFAPRSVQFGSCLSVK